MWGPTVGLSPKVNPTSFIFFEETTDSASPVASTFAVPWADAEQLGLFHVDFHANGPRPGGDVAQCRSKARRAEGLHRRTGGDVSDCSRHVHSLSSSKCQSGPSSSTATTAVWSQKLMSTSSLEEPSLWKKRSLSPGSLSLRALLELAWPLLGAAARN